MSIAHDLTHERERNNSVRGRFEIRVDEHGSRDWDALVAGFDDVNLDQTAAFSHLRWGEGRISRLTLVESGEVVAGARVAVLTQPGFAKGLAYLRGGPFWRRHGSRRMRVSIARQSKRSGMSTASAAATISS